MSQWSNTVVNVYPTNRAVQRFGKVNIAQTKLFLRYTA